MPKSKKGRWKICKAWKLLTGERERERKTEALLRVVSFDLFGLLAAFAFDQFFHLSRATLLLV